MPQGTSYNTWDSAEYKWDLHSSSSFGHMCLSHRLHNPMLPAKTLEAQKQPSRHQIIFRKNTELCCCCFLSAPKPEMLVRVVCRSCPTHPDLVAGRCCWRSRACCSAATAQNSQVLHKMQVSLFTTQLMTAVLPGITNLFLILTAPKFQLLKNSSDHKGKPFGLQKSYKQMV